MAFCGEFGGVLGGITSMWVVLATGWHGVGFAGGLGLVPRVPVIHTQRFCCLRLMLSDSLVHQVVGTRSECLKHAVMVENKK